MTREPETTNCSSSATQDQKEALARRAFMGFAKAYKYSIAFDEDAYEFCSARTERAWVAFWNGWESSEPSEATACSSSLLNRLRGIYTVPVDDGVGLLNSSDRFTRRFDGLPPINEEAAKRIEELESVLRAVLKHQIRLQRRIGLAEKALKE